MIRELVAIRSFSGRLHCAYNPSEIPRIGPANRNKLFKPSQMEPAMAGSTQRYEILFSVIAQQASRLNVMNLEISLSSATLASPSISLQNTAMEFLVRSGVESQPGAHQRAKGHRQPLALSRNSCCLTSGSKPNSRSRESSKASGFPVSAFAPAKKSAQIISSM